MKDILERDKNGEPVSVDDPEYPKIKAIILNAYRLTQEMNTQILDFAGTRKYFSALTGQKVSDDFTLWTPFYTDFGKNIRVGKNVFINHACTFMDRGGITIGNDVFIGPKVCLITENHGICPKERRTLTSKSITICDNVWIGTGAIILAGVHIGRNAIIGAGSVVTHDVPENTVVAGNPAKIINNLEE